MDLGVRNCKQQKRIPACASRSLTSAFGIRLLENIISELATSELSVLYLVCVAEQAGLNPYYYGTYIRCVMSLLWFAYSAIQ